MPLDTSESTRNAVDRLLCRPIGRALANPIALAALVTIVIMIIVIHSYDSDHLFRTTLRVFISALLLLFANNHILMNEAHCASMSNEQRSVFAQMEGGMGTKAIKPSRALPPVGGTESADVSEDGMIIEGRIGGE